MSPREAQQAESYEFDAGVVSVSFEVNKSIALAQITIYTLTVGKGSNVYPVAYLIAECKGVQPFYSRFESGTRYAVCEMQDLSQTAANL